jgi:hypothetical protein
MTAHIICGTGRLLCEVRDRNILRDSVTITSQKELECGLPALNSRGAIPSAQFWAIRSCCLEILTALLFILPSTRSLGLLVVSAYLGGAACAHFQTDQYGAIVPAVFFIGCCWIGTALKHPQILWSFRSATANATTPHNI